MKKGLGGWAIALPIGVVILLVAGLWSFVISPLAQSTGLAGDDKPLVLAQMESTFSSYRAEFDLDPIDTSAQDEYGDVDIDVFEYTVAGNDNLVAEHYVDCSGATPAVFDGSNSQVEVTSENLCVVNYYLFWQDTNFNAGDSETKLDDEIKLHEADLRVVGASGTADEYTDIKAGKTYLVTVVENASTDKQDVVPFAFLISSGTTTTLDPSEIENKNVVITFSHDYYADAVAESKFQLGGTCEDSEDGETSLDQTLEGALSSSITAGTTGVTIDCDVEIDITKDGYAIILDNPLADSNGQKSYLKGKVWGQSWTNASYGTWQELAEDATYKIKYASGDPASAGYYTMWEATYLDGIEITSDSTTNCDVNNEEKLRETPALSKNYFDDDATITIPVKFESIVAVNASGTTASAGATSADEVLGDSDNMLNLTMVTLEGTDLFSNYAIES